MPIFVNLADLVDPEDPQGRTYRQINATKQHTLPVGSLVELEEGTRLWIVYQGRDCDMTPLYWLAMRPDEENKMRWRGGFPEESLTKIK